MGDYYNDAVFGYTSSGTLGADMLNPGVTSGETDWGAILANGIRGAAQGAIGSMVRGAQQSGQIAAAQVAQKKSNQLFMLILIGGALYLATKG
jgi:hypothetical protein